MKLTEYHLKSDTFKQIDDMVSSEGQVNILMIDDDEDDRDFFQMAVNQCSYSIKCITVENGFTALDLLAEDVFLPDLIFLDLNMPMMDGRGCLVKLKKNEKTVAIPVVILSTTSHAKDIEETKNLGAISFMTKPSDIDELTNNLNFFLKSIFK